MSVIEKFKGTWTFAIIAIAVTVAAGTYAVIQVVKIEPLKDDIARQERQIAKLQKRTGIEKKTPEQRTEIKSLYARIDKLSAELEKQNQRVLELTLQLQEAKKGVTHPTDKSNRIVESEAREIILHSQSSSKHPYFYEFENFRFEIDSLKIMKSKSVVLSFSIHNKTDHELIIALDPRSGQINYYKTYPTFLMDNAGNEFRLTELSGITGKKKNSKPLKLAPKSRATASLTFEARRLYSIGTHFDFRSDLGIIGVDALGNIKRDRHGYMVSDSIVNVSISDINPD